jgi:hypothetical protein
MAFDNSRADLSAERASDFAGDLLEGAEAISGFIYGDPTKRRKVYHLAQTSRLPVFRLGAVLCARKSRILAWIKTQEERSIGDVT